VHFHLFVMNYCSNSVWNSIPCHNDDSFLCFVSIRVRREMKSRKAGRSAVNCESTVFDRMAVRIFRPKCYERMFFHQYHFQKISTHNP
jgi:hypothetical protein